ncbi:MAG TPA: glycosyltransferase [Roseiflexaceae bacterium]|nr:glycosyltransferase [Roseiflexaceae bacterium]
MDILILSPYPPYPPYGGGTMRIYQIVRGLAVRHRVTCLTFAPDEAAEHALAPLRQVCRVLTVRGPEPRSSLRRAWTTLGSPLPDMALRNASAAYRTALADLLARERFDLIQAESIEMAGYLHAGPTRSRLVLDQFNAEFVLQRRAFLADVRRPARWHAAAYSLAQWRKLARYERRVMGACDAVLAVSDDDRATLRRLAPRTPIAVVPNGVDASLFSRSALRAGLCFAGPAVVFSGTLDFRPNVDAAVWFAGAVWPQIRAARPDARLVLVGKRPAPALRRLADDQTVVVVGEVPDARPYLGGAAAYIVPMRIGGGVRLKLLEALALEAPVVSTRMGAEGIAGLRDGEHCLLADQPGAFAGAVLRLIDDPALGARLGAAGRTLVAAHYDWSVIVPRLDALYQELAASE